LNGQTELVCPFFFEAGATEFYTKTTNERRNEHP
jgi:hypothetical protein